MLRFMRLNAIASRRFGRGDYAGAADCYQRMLADDPRQTFALSMLADCQERQGLLADALATAMKAVAAVPGDFLALRTMARACLNTGDPHTAKLYVERALAATPSPVSAAEVRWILRVGRLFLGAMRLLPRYRKRLSSVALADFDPNRDAREWTTWAHEYLAWYADTFSDSGSPVN